MLPVCLVRFNSTIPRSQSFIIIAASDLPPSIKCCFVVFGVMLRLLVINTSSSSRANNKRRRLPAMSVINLPLFGAAVCTTLDIEPLTTCNEAR